MRYLIALACFSLAGCATSQNVTLVNDKGEKRYCYKTSEWQLGAIARTAEEFNRCLNDAGASGFRKSE